MHNSGSNLRPQIQSIVFRIMVLFTFLMATTVSAEDWPSWRGPSGQGFSKEKNLPLNWNKDGTNILWKAKLPGQEGKNRQDQNQSSPIIIKNQIIISASFWREGIDAPKEYPEHHVVCFDLTTGA